MIDTMAPYMEHKIVTLLIVAVIAASLGFFGNFYISRRTKKEDKISKISQAIEKEIRALGQVAAAYWLVSPPDVRKEKLQAAEIKIKASFKALSHLHKAISPQLKKHSRSKVDIELRDFISDIYEIITADDFESNSRQPSRAKAAKILSKTSMMCVKISTLPHPF